MREHLENARLMWAGAVAFLLILCSAFLAPSRACAAEQPSDVVPPIVVHLYDPDSVVSSRSWFGGTLTLVTEQTFVPHNFDGSNVGIEMTASCSVNGTFTVSLYRSSFLGNSLVGTAAFKRNGFTKATWEGVGSGTYYFVCRKSADSKVVTSSDVAMYSW